jgi:protease I
MGKTNKILMVIAPVNFRDEEYLIPKKIFEENGFKILTLSKDVDIAKGKLGAEVKVDLKLDKDIINSNEFDAVIFVGGLGALVYENDEKINQIILDFSAKNKLIGAICIAPRVVGSSGIYEGKKVTVWNGDGEQSKILENEGATVLNKDVVVNDNYVTANGPHAAKEFAEEIVKILKNK